MSQFLSAVGRFSARFRWVVIVAWLVIFAALIGVFVVGSNANSNSTAETSIPDSPASLALERMEEHFPAADDNTASLQLVFQPDSGDVTSDATASAIAEVLSEANDLPGVQSVNDPLDPTRPYLSEDLALAVATLTYGELTEDEGKDFYDAALELQENAPPALGVELGGNLLPLGAPAPGIGEGVGVLIAFVVLALTFSALIAAGVNLLIAVFGVGVGLMGILAYGSLTPIGDNTIILASMLGLAVGIDYSLFILSRFRNELRAGRTVDDAVARATGTAGTAVVFAGLTVIVALVALLVANLSFMTEMGIAAAFAVLVAVLLALTLLPALMRFLGVRALSKKQRHALEHGELWAEGQKQKRGIMRGWGSFVVNKPVISLLSGVLLLVVVALPMLSMKTAFNVPGGADPESTERAAYNLILAEFGGAQSPLIVLAEGDDVASSTGSIERDLADIAGVQQVIPAEVSSDGTAARIIVIPDGGPIDQETKDIVHTIRDAERIPGVTLEVTGETAIGIDQDEQLMQALIKYIIVIVVISILLLIVLFRSVLIPIVATAGFLLSVGASFGASVAVFQWGWLDPLIAAPQGDPMLSLLPLLLVGVLFGLAMDYQVFLVSRIQEMHRKGMDPKPSIREGFARSGPVLVAAATIMLVVFGGFATSHFAIGASIAFGLMVGVAADAFIVRMVLMPAVLSLLGKSAWWIPTWLDRILPNVDVEGHSLDSNPPAAVHAQPLREPVRVN
ncbi:RND superfamily putative drug exporter [Microbacterium terrae]|uniref:Membrane protein YdfJ n=1 Tax=Microbacterium terrae TaxID=69369 RepID=A0A0M2HJH9_9MICO|nr:MMPL family transporter [Microbacterium terrae]KJL44513.1 Membrane protein YdfJ [Microbacterium terrae]MBP1079484.1 RND superfamily putative drug exporter [Microbacterium terrae]GLJ96824.1 membrane protein [Microbacterium terrae]